MKFPFPSRLLKGMCFPVLILPKCGSFCHVSSSLLLTCFCPLLTPSLLASPHSSADLGPSALALSVLVSLLHVTAPPRSTGQSSHCSEALVQAVSLISVPPCSLWLHTPFLGSCLSSLKRSHTQFIPSLFIKIPCSKPLAEAVPVSCQHVRSLALPQCTSSSADGY